MNDKILEIQIDAPPGLVKRLCSALEQEKEYPKEQDLLDYVFVQITKKEGGNENHLEGPTELL